MEPDTSFPIVGIGASAGGLHSLECFLEALPGHFDFAIVFIQHLSPAHKSLMPELLRSKWRDHAFIDIEDGLQLLPGRLYLCPPAIEVRIHEGAFRVIARPEGHIHFPIDEFLVSLAEYSAERAVAVIFSGAGTDGVRGIKAVRTQGGTVFVQDPATAQFPDLPQAAIKTGQVDGVLPPPDIAREIGKLLGSGAVTETPDSLIASADLEPFFLLIREKTGHRFNHYKKSVISRRIKRRMSLQGISSVTEYLNIVADKPGEAVLLAGDLMIGVTSFFRDRLAWKALSNGVIRKLVAEGGVAPIRVWTPACATGEESYSIAMMLRHELDLAGRKNELQVFATDVNDGALEKAREGKYPASIAAEIPADFIKKFFTETDDGIAMTISKELRQHVIFAKQDLLTDPPFSRLDLVICRNLLIYLEPDAQEKCITLFHYALRPGGYLFLGNAESPGRKSALFKSMAHKKCRVYEKVEIGASSRLPINVPFAAERSAITLRQQSAMDQSGSVIQLSQETLLEEYAPAAVTIDQHYDILYHNGPTNRYLSQPRGAHTRNLIELLPEKLRSRLRGAIYKVTKEAKPVSISAAFSGDEGQKRQVSVLVSKMKDNLILIAFREKEGPPVEVSSESYEAACADEPATRQLEIELSVTRQELQTNIEQLKSLNEEMQSSNEELQAANEELETSREELQSLNEELITVNSQLQCKVEEQEETNDDLNNFFSSTNIPTIFLDRSFRVKRFTAAITKLIKLIPSDIGRQIIDMSQELLGPELIADAGSVLENLVPVRKEINIDGTWYVRAVLPYRTLDDRIEGVVVTYNDVTELKRAEEQSAHLASFPQLNPNPVIEADLSGKVIFSNPATGRYLERLKLDPANTDAFLPQDFADIVVKWDGDNESSQYREMTIGDRHFAETIYLSPQFNNARIYAFDITERRKAEEEIVKAKEEWERTFDTVPDLIAILDCNHTVLRVNKAMADRLGLPSEKCIGIKCYDAVHGTSESPSFCPHALTCLDSNEHIAEVHEPRLGGDFIVSTTPIFDEHGRLTGAVHVARDITARKLAESEREMAVEFLKLVNESKSADDLVHAATDFFQRKSGCEAVGIRLRDEHDYPYYETRGFPAEFVMAENRLCACDKDGKPIFDGSGNPVLDCMCGNVICGRFDSSKPFFTKRGNFWSNNTTELLATTTEKDRKARTRNRCNGEGYESVALIGLTLGDERLGLLQLNDKRTGRFTPESLALLERLADYLAVALSKFRTDEELRKSEERFRLLAANVKDYAIFMLDPEGRVLTWNVGAERLKGYKAEEIIGHHFSRFYTPEDVAENKPEKELQTAIETGQAQDEGRRVRKDGSSFMADVLITALRDEKGKLRGFAKITRDITERKHAEAELRRLNKTLRALSDSSQAIVRAEEEQQYLNDTCKIIVEDCGFKMVWIGFAEKDELKSVRPVAHAGFDEGYLDTHRITWDDTERGRGPTGTAIRTGKVSVCRDMLNDPAFTPWREEALKRGYASSIVLPLFSDGKVFGAITIYSEEPDPFSESEIQLLTDLAGNLSYGIQALHVSAARRDAEEALSQSRKTFLELVERAPFGIYVVDSRFRIAQMNVGSQNGAFRNVRPVIGRDFAEAMRILWPETVAAEIIALFRHTLDTGEPYYSSRFINPRQDAATVEAYEWQLHRMTLPDGQYGVICYYFDSTSLREAEEALRTNNEELERFNRVAVGRELRMVELKKEVNEFCGRVGEPPRYTVDFEEQP